MLAVYALHFVWELDLKQGQFSLLNPIDSYFEENFYSWDEFSFEKIHCEFSASIIFSIDVDLGP